MASTSNRTTRSTMTTTIRNKQSLYGRFNRRFNMSHNPGERTFLKQEINRVCSELKQCAKQWKSCGFGSNTWVCRGCTSKTISTAGSWTGATSRNTRRSKNTRSKTHSSNRSGTKSRRPSTKSSRRNRSSVSRNRSFSFAW